MFRTPTFIPQSLLHVVFIYFGPRSVAIKGERQASEARYGEVCLPVVDQSINLVIDAAAFRFFRVLLRLNNRNLFNHLIKIDALGPILDLTLRESRRDNLLSSTCQEFFEHIRKVG